MINFSAIVLYAISVKCCGRGQVRAAVARRAGPGARARAPWPRMHATPTSDKVTLHHHCCAYTNYTLGAEEGPRTRFIILIPGNDGPRQKMYGVISKIWYIRGAPSAIAVVGDHYMKSSTAELRFSYLI